MTLYLMQAVVFLILYSGSYLLGLWSQKLMKSWITRPLPFSGHAAGLGLVYLTAAIFTVVMGMVVTGGATFESVLHSEAAMMALSLAFSVVLVPSVLVLLVVGVLHARRNK